MSHRVLIVEDEQELAEILGEYFNIEGYEVRLAPDGEMGLKYMDDFKPDLVILDIMLPVMDGMTVCKKIRENLDIPIIMLSAKNGEMDKVICLGIGADDYVTKPFSPLELVARVKAHLRRFDQLHIEKEASEHGLKVKAGRLTLYRESYSARVDNLEIDFTTREFEILYFLASQSNQVFSREQIYENIWGMNQFGDISSVAVYIKRIRKKLEQHNVDYIKTVWGIGYKFSIL